MEIRRLSRGSGFNGVTLEVRTFTGMTYKDLIDGIFEASRGYSWTGFGVALCKLFKFGKLTDPYPVQDGYEYFGVME